MKSYSQSQRRAKQELSFRDTRRGGLKVRGGREGKGEGGRGREREGEGEGEREREGEKERVREREANDFNGS